MNRRHVLLFVWFALCAITYGVSALLGASLLTRAIVTLVVAIACGEVIVCLTLRRIWARRRRTAAAKALQLFVASLIEGAIMFVSLSVCLWLRTQGRPLGIHGLIIVFALAVFWQTKATMVAAKYFTDLPTQDAPRG